MSSSGKNNNENNYFDWNWMSICITHTQPLHALSKQKNNWLIEENVIYELGKLIIY